MFFLEPREYELKLAYCLSKKEINTPIQSLQQIFLDNQSLQQMIKFKQHVGVPSTFAGYWILVPKNGLGPVQRAQSAEEVSGVTTLCFFAWANWTRLAVWQQFGPSSAGRIAATEENEVDGTFTLGL